MRVKIDGYNKNIIANRYNLIISIWEFWKDNSFVLYIPREWVCLVHIQKNQITMRKENNYKKIII
jgi:hypothetical protein